MKTVYSTSNLPYGVLLDFKNADGYVRADVINGVYTQIYSCETDTVVNRFFNLNTCDSNVKFEIPDAATIKKGISPVSFSGAMVKIVSFKTLSYRHIMNTTRNFVLNTVTTEVSQDENGQKIKTREKKNTISKTYFTSIEDYLFCCETFPPISQLPAMSFFQFLQNKEITPDFTAVFDVNNCFIGVYVSNETISRIPHELIKNVVLL